MQLKIYCEIKPDNFPSLNRGLFRLRQDKSGDNAPAFAKGDLFKFSFSISLLESNSYRLNDAFSWMDRHFSVGHYIIFKSATCCARFLLVFKGAERMITMMKKREEV